MYRTLTETNLSVHFPGNQEFFGLIGTVGRYTPDVVTHTHIKDQYYTFPDGTVTNQAAELWQREVSKAQAAGKRLFADPNKFNLSLITATSDGETAQIVTKRINYRDFKVASQPEIQKQIDEGDLDPHLMLAQCQVISGRLNGESVLLQTYRKKSNNEYRPDQLHNVGGHHIEQEGTIWQTFINEQTGETAIPIEVINQSRTIITGFGWDRGIQKPEILGVVEINEDYDLAPNVGTGRGVRTYVLPDHPTKIVDHLLACFPHLVPPGVAAQYNHLILNHGDEGTHQAKRLVDGIQQQTVSLRELHSKQRGNIVSALTPIIISKTNEVHQAAGLESFETITEEAQLDTIALHFPYYLSLIRGVSHRSKD